MAFPTSPSDGDFYNENGVTWLYVSPPGVWTKAGGTPIKIDESDPVFTASEAVTYTEAPSDGTPYSRQDGGWVAAAGSAYGDADVDTHLNTGTAGAGEVLSWTGSDYDWIAAGGGATVINDLTDVNTAGVTGGDVLKWNGSQWTPTVDDDVDSLVDLTDTTITTPANGEVLTYNGASWVNAAAGGGGSLWEDQTSYYRSSVPVVIGSATETPNNINGNYTGITVAGTSGGAINFTNGANLQGRIFGQIGNTLELRPGTSGKIQLSDTSGIQRLRVDGATGVVKIGWDSDSPYSLPGKDGTANQVLTTNGSGTVTWAAAGGGSSLAIDESGRIESNDWITTANSSGEDRFFFKASDSVSANPAWRGQVGGGFQYNFFNTNESITMSCGTNGAVEITGRHSVTGGVEGLRINGIGGGTAANQTVWIATNGTDRIEVRGPNIIMPTLPTSDPGISGALWNDTGTLKISP